MDVYVIPVGRDRYELYCEPTADAEFEADGEPPRGLVGRLWRQFSDTIRAAEDRQRAPPSEARSWLARWHERLLGWVVHRIAEQRLLWTLRRHTAASAAHPPDMAFDQVMTLVHGTLRRDYERHRLWLAIDVVGLVVSGPVAIVPGPNLLAYFFVFRVVGHWLSMRGATQGLHRVEWSGRPCPPLTELRDIEVLEPSARDARIQDIADRLRLQHLTTFFARVGVRHA